MCLHRQIAHVQCMRFTDLYCSVGERSVRMMSNFPVKLWLPANSQEYNMKIVRVTGTVTVLNWELRQIAILRWSQWQKLKVPWLGAARTCMNIHQIRSTHKQGKHRICWTPLFHPRRKRCLAQWCQGSATKWFLTCQCHISAICKVMYKSRSLCHFSTFSCGFYSSAAFTRRRLIRTVPSQQKPWKQSGTNCHVQWKQNLT